MSKYIIDIRVTADSTLSEKELKKLLVIALWDEETWVTLDWSSEELEVIDYDTIDIELTN